MAGRMRNRSEDLSPAGERKRKSRAGGKDVDSIHGDPSKIAVPSPPTDWHPYASAMYRSLLVSPMVAYWSPSDYMVAFMAVDMYNRVLGQGNRPSADMMRVVMQMLSSVGADERERRSMGIEVHMAPEPEDPEMAALWAEFEAEGFGELGATEGDD